MTPVDQTIVHDPESGAIGNCMQAAIASILDLPLDDVPHFAQLYEDPKECGDALFAWLVERRILWLQLDLDQPLPDDMPCLMYGDSPRGLPHLVVCVGSEMVHDPHPSREGLSEALGVWILAPYLPA